MALISLAWRETGSKYLAMEVYAMEILKLTILVSNFIIGSKLYKIIFKFLIII